MKVTSHRNIGRAAFSLGLIVLGVGISHAQYTTGYGTVYGSFGLAMATQNMYNASQMQMRRAMARNAMIQKWGLAAVEKAEREAAAKSSGANAAPASNPQITVPPPRVVRNYGVFRPDATVDTGKALAEALGETPEEKALIKKIFVGTKTAYESAAAQKGWKNNIAGGLTFFTVTAMTIYRNADEPGDDAVDNYYKIVNGALDEMPAFASVANKDKQNFNNMLIGFGGLLLAGYTEGKQINDAATIDTYKKLAGGLIQLVLKTDPENLQIVNGQIVLK
ncbi:MAG: DUF6683 family protein [Acidobacteriota bacterium]